MKAKIFNKLRANFFSFFSNKKARLFEKQPKSQPVCKELKWFETYLIGRTQQTECCSARSTTINKLTSGVPQSSVLCPLRFII